MRLEKIVIAGGGESYTLTVELQEPEMFGLLKMAESRIRHLAACGAPLNGLREAWASFGTAEAVAKKAAELFELSRQANTNKAGVEITPPSDRRAE